LIDVVNLIEKEGECNLRVCGVDLWPVLRNLVLSGAREIPAQQYRPVIKNKIAPFVFVKSIWRALKNRHSDSLVFFDKKFLVSGFGEAAYLKASEIFFENLSVSRKTILLCKPSAKLSNKFEISFYHFIVVGYFLAKLASHRVFNKKISNYVDPIISFIQNRSKKEVNIDKAKLIRNIYFVILTSCFLKMALRILRPKKCYIFCYYSPFGMALCSACNQMGLEVVDIQHGVGGRNMRSYGRWMNVPTRGYTTLPSMFYCWTRRDTTSIQEWAVKTNLHRAKELGSFFHRFFFHAKLHKEFLFPLAIKKKFSRFIIFTASSASIPELIIRLIKSSDPRILFLIRMHPDVRGLNLISVENKMKKYGENVLVEEATNLPIQSVMSVSDVHITEWSAAVYDAYFLGVPSVVITDEGKDYFVDFIESGHVEHAKNLEDLQCSLRNLIDKGSQL